MSVITSFMSPEQALLMRLKFIRQRLKDHWTDETAHHASRKDREPFSSKGQCAVTAIILKDHLGGQIISTKVNGHSHWLNIIDGFFCDITGDQFGYAPIYCSMEYTYAHPWTVRHRVTDRDTIKRAKLLAEAAGYDDPFLPKDAYPHDRLPRLRYPAPSTH